MGVVQLLLMLIVLAYLAGSVPFGLLVGLSRGIDPRKSGSGNIGATNVGRLLGGRFFAIVFTLDLLKSLIPMLAAGVVIHGSRQPAVQDGWKIYLLWLAVGFAAILGHMFSIFLGFKGGKGVATSAGVMVGLYPYYTLPAAFAILLWLGVFLAWRYVSLASMIAAAAFPVLYIAVGVVMRWPVLAEQLPLTIFAVFVGVLIVVRHRSNLSRLRAGTEHAFR